MTTRPFRFAVSLMPTGRRADWSEKCRRAEDLGYDVITVTDYVDRQSPLLALAAAAESTTRPRVGTYVLNAGFYRPTLLARDVTAFQQITDDRLELGIGTGYARSDFEAAGVSWGTARQRIDHLEQTVLEVRKAPGGRTPPILVGGTGSQVLAVAAAHADIISMPGALSRTSRSVSILADYATLSARVDEVRQAVSKRVDEVELNLLVQMIRATDERDGGLAFLSTFAEHLSEDDIAKLPTLLSGSPQAMAEKLLSARETLGFSYFTILEPMMGDFASVMPLLR